MIEKFNIFYEQENQWVLLSQFEGVLTDLIEQINNYPKDKKYLLERMTILGSEIINFE